MAPSLSSSEVLGSCNTITLDNDDATDERKVSRGHVLPYIMVILELDGRDRKCLLNFSQTELFYNHKIY